jgi:Ca2+-binding EF-hand superfamily protein
MEELN